MAEGRLVPMETTMVIVKKAMLERAQEEQNKTKFLITGFPRSLQQAKVFEMEVKKPMAVLYLECSENVMHQRLMKSNTFKGAAHMSKQTHTDTFHQRYKTFEENTLPVIKEYEQQGLVSSLPPQIPFPGCRRSGATRRHLRRQVIHWPMGGAGVKDLGHGLPRSRV